ncbi:MAG TPA: SAM-dependent methyltransferase [Coxiellaceae bacterium]|nr:MAG: 23S rRNA methyltransferase [Gammaproteobacteria bacterium RIFCSPHIGHO2_12_FULL_36_30]HLB56572.1 SAM-dependent methyltransferase [Coxiellaceae bacterium]
MTGSRAWLRRHVTDPFVKEAKRQGYVSRSAFKLLAIQEKDKIFKSGMTVVDLGAAPGGWLQITSQCIGDRGKIIAVDLLPLEIMPPQVTFIQGDFNDEIILNQLIAALDQKKADVIISDIAPNLTGQSCIDLPRSIHLLELALDCAEKILKPGGTLLFKAFQGEGLEAFLKEVKSAFKQVKYRKPDASRSESKELYVLAIGFQGRYT